MSMSFLIVLSTNSFALHVYLIWSMLLTDVKKKIVWFFSCSVSRL